MKKQTAVEYLIQEIKHAACVKSKSMSEWNKVFEKAKQMEREQMIDFADKVSLERLNESIYSPFNIEQYYNETYKGGEK